MLLPRAVHPRVSSQVKYCSAKIHDAKSEGRKENARGSRGVTPRIKEGARGFVRDEEGATRKKGVMEGAAVSREGTRGSEVVERVGKSPLQLQSGQISGAETNKEKREEDWRQRNCSGYCEKRNETKRNAFLALPGSFYIYAAVDKPRLRSSNTARHGHPRGCEGLETLWG